MGKVLSLKELKHAVFEGKSEIVIDANTILTPSAKDFALTGAIKLVTEEKQCSETKVSNNNLKAQIKRMIEVVAKEKNIKLTKDKANLIINEVYKAVN